MTLAGNQVNVNHLSSSGIKYESKFKSKTNLFGHYFCANALSKGTNPYLFPGVDKFSKIVLFSLGKETNKGE